MAQHAAHMQDQLAHHVFLAAEVDVERTLSNAGLGGDGADRGFGKAPPADLALGGIEYLAAGDFAATGFRQRQGAFPRVHARHESVVILVSPIRPPAVKRQERSEEHTRTPVTNAQLVCRLLLAKKK